MSTENAKKTVLFNKSHIDNLKLRIDTLQKDLEQKVTDLEKTINETINKKIQAIESEITTLKKSVSDGKKTLTTTITGYGQAVSDSDSDGVSEFSEINTGIVGLMNYGNATEAYVYPNKTFTAGGKRRTGNMSLARSETISVNSISTSLPNKYYEGCTINAQAVYNNGYDNGYDSGITVAPFIVMDPNAYQYVGPDAVHNSDMLMIQLTNKDFYNKIRAWASDGSTGVSISVCDSSGNISSTIANGIIAEAAIPSSADYICATFNSNTSSHGLNLTLFKG